MKKNNSNYCVTCQACCKWGHAVLSRDDVLNISKYLGKSEREFETLFLDNELSKKHNIKILKSSINNGDGCIFLEKNGCLVYDVRPIKCRLFPREEHIDNELKRICKMATNTDKKKH